MVFTESVKNCAIDGHRMKKMEQKETGQEKLRISRPLILFRDGVQIQGGCRH